MVAGTGNDEAVEKKPSEITKEEIKTEVDPGQQSPAEESPSVA